MLTHRCIADRFINWEDATIKVLKSYEAMKHCKDNSADALLKANDRLYSLKGATTDKEPVQGGGSRPEDNWINAIDHKEIIKTKLTDANSYMDWFSPAWKKLTEKERIVLYERWIVQREDEGKWVDSVKARLHIEQRQCYREAKEALDRLRMMLFGI